MTSEQRAEAEASIMKSQEKIKHQKQKFNIKVLSSVPYAKKKASADVHSESPTNQLLNSLSGHNVESSDQGMEPVGSPQLDREQKDRVASLYRKDQPKTAIDLHQQHKHELGSSATSNTRVVSKDSTIDRDLILCLEPL